MTSLTQAAGDIDKKSTAWEEKTTTSFPATNLCGQYVLTSAKHEFGSVGMQHGTRFEIFEYLGTQALREGWETGLHANNALRWPFG